MFSSIMIKANVQEIATKNGITTAYQLQKLLNIQPSLAAKWFANDLKMISFESLNALCKHFNCTPDDILVYVADADAAEALERTKESSKKKATDAARKDKASNVAHTTFNNTSQSNTKLDKPKESNTQADNTQISNTKSGKTRKPSSDVISANVLKSLPELPEGDKWITTKDISKWTGHPISSIREWYNKQGLERTRIGMKNFVKHSDFEKFMNKRNKEILSTPRGVYIKR